MYSPILGTFVSRDPLAQRGEPDILSDNNWFGQRLTLIRNLYSYTGNNPVNAIDPSGMAELVAAPEETGYEQNAARPKKKKKKYCLYDFKSRSGTADECFGFDAGDVYCDDCPKLGFCDKEKTLETEENCKTCTITFKRQMRRCGTCPKGGKDRLGRPIGSVEV